MIRRLTREEMCSVIEGRGAASRVPVLLDFWVHDDDFIGKEEQVALIRKKYVQDAQFIQLNIPDAHVAPQDDASYRWSYRDALGGKRGYDSDISISDWETQLQPLLQDFPSPHYKKLIPASPPDDGSYRLGYWWYCLFERLWSIRGMENTLMDFYLHGDAVHAVFRALTDFYKVMMTRAKRELALDGIMTTDDLGTQQSTFFSVEIFKEFFYPYYKEIVDHAHGLGMHFWLHACGNIKNFLPLFYDIGVDVLHPVQKYAMDEVEIAKEYGGKFTFWAGFDVQKIIPFGSADDVEREVQHLMQTYKRSDGRFLFTAGNGINRDCKLDCLERLYHSAFKYGEI